MNKFGRTNTLQLSSINSIPSHQTLTEMLSTAQKNPQRIVSLRFQIPENKCKYELEAVLQTGSSGLVGRRGQAESGEPHWTLYRERPPVSDTPNLLTPAKDGLQIWSHITGDVGLVHNLIWSETTGTNQATTETFGLYNSLSKAALGGRPYSNTTNTPAMPSEPVELPPEQEQSGSHAPLLSISLAGELTEIELSDVLQAISICKMTGRLDLGDKLEQAELYFEDGALVHAQLLNALDQSPRIVGDQVVLEVITWETGSFFFHRGRNTKERTIKRKLEGLLLEGAGLSDYRDYLRKAGITSDSILIKIGEPLSDQALCEKLLSGVPIDANLQKKLFEPFDGKTTMGDIIHASNMPKSLWLPILFNLLSCELIGLKRAQETGASIAQQFVIDDFLIQQEVRNLTRLDTGLCSYLLTQHLLKQELARYEHAKTIFSIAILSIKENGEMMSRLATQQMADRFAEGEYPFSVLGHCRDEDYLMILPFRSDREAQVVISNFAEQIKSWHFEGGDGASTLTIHAGIASVPHDSEKLVNLLGAAEEAKLVAVERNVDFITSRELKWERLRSLGEQAIKAENFHEAEAIWAAAFSEAEEFAVEDERLSYTAEMLTSVLQKNDKYSTAESLLRLLMELKRKTFGVRSAEMAGVAGALSHCLYQEGKYNEAGELLKQVIATWQAIGGESHPAVASYSYNLASVYHAQDKLEDAKPLYKRSFEIRLAIFGPDHPNTIKSKQSYEKLLRLLDLKQESRTSAEFITGSWTFVTEEESQHYLSVKERLLNKD
jgi:tetratricopeptide (TPR) repeat protein